MRKPKIHLGFSVENIRGVSTILIGKDDAESCINKSSLKNLHFITAGPIPPNPSELILNPKMNDLIDYLKSLYDIVIIDTPPVGIVTDGIKIIQNADYPIYILRSVYSKRMFIQNINNDVKIPFGTGNVQSHNEEHQQLKYDIDHGGHVDRNLVG